MKQYNKEELIESLNVIDSTIRNCEKIHPKFSEGTSQHTLLKNRIKALYVSKALMNGENTREQYTKEEMLAALPPVVSIISKSEKAQLKFTEGIGHYTRLNKIIKAMYIAKALIEDEINNRG